METQLPLVYRVLLQLLCIVMLSSAARAQQPLDNGWEDPLAVHAAALNFLQSFAAAHADAVGGMARTSVGQPDARLHLASCGELQGYLPPGARTSGKTLVGVRCLSGRAWQVFLPAEIHIEAPAWVSTQMLAAGHVLTQDDVAQRSVEVVVSDADNRVLTALDAAPYGQTLARALGPGATLRVSDLHDASRIAAGDAVQVIYVGSGFTVSGEGKSIAPASPGQSVQVKMANGSVISGVLQQEHTIKVDL